MFNRLIKSIVRSDNPDSRNLASYPLGSSMRNRETERISKSEPTNPSCGLQDSECEALWSRLKRQMKRCAVARSTTAVEVYNYKFKKLLIL